MYCLSAYHNVSLHTTNIPMATQTHLVHVHVITSMLVLMHQLEAYFDALRQSQCVYHHCTFYHQHSAVQCIVLTNHCTYMYAHNYHTVFVLSVWHITSDQIHNENLLKMLWAQFLWKVPKEKNDSHTESTFKAISLNPSFLALNLPLSFPTLILSGSRATTENWVKKAIQYTGPHSKYLQCRRQEVHRVYIHIDGIRSP